MCFIVPQHDHGVADLISAILAGMMLDMLARTSHDSRFICAHTFVLKMNDIMLLYQVTQFGAGTAEHLARRPGGMMEV